VLRKLIEGAGEIVKVIILYNTWKTPSSGSGLSGDFIEGAAAAGDGSEIPKTKKKPRSSSRSRLRFRTYEETPGARAAEH